VISFGNYWRELRGYSRALQLFFISDIMLAFTVSTIGLLYNLHLLALGYTADDIGILSAAAAAAQAILAVPLGFLADRIGRQRVYAGGGWVYALAFLGAIWTRSFPLLVAYNAVMQVGFIALLVGEQPILAGEVPAGRNAMLLSIMFINFFAWNTLGTLLAGYLPEWLPYGPYTHYQTALTIAAAWALLSAVVRSFMRPQAGGRVSGRLRLVPSRRVLQWGLVTLFSIAPITLLQQFGNVILDQRYHLDSGRIGLLVTAGMIVSVVAAWFAPSIAERWGQRPTLLALSFAMALVMAVGGALSALPWFILVFLARTAVTMVRNPVGGAFSMESTPPADRTAMTSFNQVGAALGAALAARVFGALLAGEHYALPFFLAAAAALVAAGAFYLFFGARDRERGA